MISRTLGPAAAPSTSTAHLVRAVLGCAGAAMISVAALACSSPAGAPGDSQGSSAAPVVRGAVVGSAGPWTAPVCGEGCNASCVEPTRFLVRGPVIKDTVGSKLWQRDPGPRLALVDADAYCSTLSLGDATSGWRLPAADELETLQLKPGYLQAGRADFCAPSIDQAAFPAALPEYHWTADRVGVSRPGAAALSFFDGRMHNYPADQELAVRCVHDAM